MAELDSAFGGCRTPQGSRSTSRTRYRIPQRSRAAALRARVGSTQLVPLRRHRRNTMDHGPPGGYYPDAKRQRTAKPDHAFSKQQSGYEFQQHKMNAAVAAQGGRQKAPASKVAIRRAGGKTWRDDTLEQWPEGDFRLFVGNIGNEVTDELLSHSFGRYPSLARAKVIRNKHTNKSKGYAFISFMDPFDCAKALREMSGKYIGNRHISASRRVGVVSLHSNESSPGMMEVGGLFFDFGAIRTALTEMLRAGPASSRRARGTNVLYQRCGRRTRRSARPRSSGGSRRK